MDDYENGPHHHARLDYSLHLVILPLEQSTRVLMSRARNYLDRQNIAASKLANIMVDLDMSVQQYNTCVSILFVGYSMSLPIVPMAYTDSES